MTTLNPLRVVTEKLKLLNHGMEELKVDFRKLNTDDDRKSYYAEVKSIRSSKINYDKTYTEPNSCPTNLKDRFKQCLKESSERQEIQIEWMKKIMISTDLSLKNHNSSIKRPMLVTTHTKIDVYGKKISLGVRQNKVVFKINKKESPASISPICVINEFDKTQEFGNLVMNDEKKGEFESYLSPEYGSQDIISLSPSKSAEINEDSSMTLCDPDKRISIELEDYVNIHDLWGDLDPVKQHNSMGPLLKISDEDKKKGIRNPVQKIKGFYRGCLSLGNEYKYDQEVVDWIQGCINDGMT
ncbi:hypothetical protein Tco_0497468 [Tanacetum coccineum]